MTWAQTPLWRAGRWGQEDAAPSALSVGAGTWRRARSSPVGHLSLGRCVQHGKEKATLGHGKSVDLQIGWCGTSDMGTGGLGERRLKEGRWSHHALLTVPWC